MSSVKEMMNRVVEQQSDESTYEEILRELAFAGMRARESVDARAERTASEALSDIQNILDVLETVAKSYDPSSKEYAAVLMASWALVYVSRQELHRKFKEFVDQVYRGELSETQLEKLRAMGFEVDEL